MLLTIIDQRLGVFWEAAVFETTPGFQICGRRGKDPLAVGQNWRQALVPAHASHDLLRILSMPQYEVAATR
jgi:hypothetical protein